MLKRSIITLIVFVAVAAVPAAKKKTCSVCEEDIGPKDYCVLLNGKEVHFRHGLDAANAELKARKGELAEMLKSMKK